MFAGPSATTPRRTTRETAPAAPGHTRYWIDTDARLRRFSARLSGATDWLVATFSA
ncbi:hypothetical protein [Streptomyces sp. DSM 15324]|uniref:hypothetical protein n=1 Tax=Streptomyces sp. DSM 15324 TaxID=1739111 RepID=UPI000A676267|nr:hypothetical protein [Streptomyces sp. DSM 15324]